MKQLSIIVITLVLMFLFRGKTEAQDWPNLARYQEQNLAIGAPEENENRVVFMGNSITEGWLRECPGFFEGKSYICRGISGQTTPQMLLLFRADVINLKPKVVVIMAGTNDIAGNTGPSTLEMISNNLKSMAELAVANGIRVVFCSVLPASEFPWRKGQEPADKIIALNQLIRTYAVGNEMAYVDFHSVMVNDEKGLDKAYSNDGVHPTKAGYEVMNPLVESAIKKILDEL